MIKLRKSQLTYPKFLNRTFAYYPSFSSIITPQFFNKYQYLVSNIDNLLFAVSANGLVKFNSQNIRCDYPLKIDSSTKRLFFDFYYDYVCSVFSLVDEKVQTTYPYIELPIKNSVGKHAWVKVNLFLTNLQNEPLLYGTVEDFSHEKSSNEHKVDITNEAASTLISSLETGVLMEDENRRVIITNKSLLNIFDLNLNPNDLIGQNCQLMAHEMKSYFKYPEQFIDFIEMNVQGHTVKNGEILELKNGKILERDYLPIQNKNGKYRHIWKYRDITLKYNIDKQIKQSEEKHRGIIENMQLGIIEVDTNDIIINAYNKLCEMTGYEPDELIGKKAYQVLIKNSHIETYKEAKNRIIKGDGKPYEIPVIRKDGATIWVIVSSSPIYNEQNQLSGLLSIFYDITERKKLEQELELANKVAAAAQESERLFLTSMTHELKTPINAIIGMTDLLKLTQLNREQLDYLGILETSTKFLQKLITDILDISKIESGNIQINAISFDLNKMLTDTVKTFEHTLGKKNIDLVLDLDFSLDSYIIGDPLLLQQILINLLSNAEKFTTKGQITVKISIVNQTSQNVKIGFSVKDTGIGFELDNKDLIFNKFFQLPSVSQHKSEGVGLGLTIVKKLIELHESEIKVKSKKGKGSEFSFELTFDKGLKLEAPKVLNSRTEDNIPTNFQNLRILVVEDNLLNQQYLERVMNKWSVNYDVAKSGEEAIQIFDKKRFDLVFMDLQLPGIDGFETAVKLRTNFPERTFIIIAMTAVVFPKIEREVLKFGMDDIIKKPFTLTELSNKINSYFPKSSFDETTEPQNIFICELDKDFLNEFYIDDYRYALEVFKVFESEYLKELESILASTKKDDLSTIKKRLHRIKASFKMVGLSELENIISFFILKNNNTIADLKKMVNPNDITYIKNIIKKQISILENVT
ncbi:MULTISPECIES: PAS domain-containing sensor histidine kinase [Emticicia]|uniref:PAS domain-containing sensor histidine kinase n=1 Tax=Emticicia TaxID=312278 RepID=UPI0007D8BF5B|nr:MULTISPECIES: PAS domain-containing sensor histidine kinase [Emticicia]